MTLRGLLTDRQKLIAELERETGLKAIYSGAPLFRYSIGPYTILRDGQVDVADEDADIFLLQRLAAMYYIEDDHIPIVTTELWEKVQSKLDAATRKAAPTKSSPAELTNQNYPYRNHLYCAGCGHRLIRSVRAGRVLWECDGKRRFTKEFCTGVSVTDDEVREWRPIEEDVYVSEIREKGKVLGHEFVDWRDWNQKHQKKIHISSAPELTESNYPYMNRIFCKYCGSRLRRIINKNNTVTWICDELSRRGKKGCRGVRMRACLVSTAGLAGILSALKEF